ncbi:two-component sensor histidine kinase [Desulfosarcina ovata subsp. sediminis]|uniref:histidine kinase n=1 Tax=Desulfosarcina ovata subsp. sediminis TaxID=885957 RepID=A0A5K8A0U4_9BACT|nr:ATP-binding protein [Desulfosarcina ovata]BBO86087.1 two-component sensor histidine kinase [Desulfosarcina ovata subsp. sediminis]
MSFVRTIRLPRTLSFRLTLWYGLIFSLSAGVAFLFFYVLISYHLRQRMDSQLSGKISEFEAIYNLQGLEDVKAAALIESQAAGEKKIFFRLLYASGVAFSSSNMSYWQSIGINRWAVRRLVDGKSARVYETLNIPNRPDRVRIAYGIIGRGVVVQLGYSMESDTTFIAIFKRIFLITMAVLIFTAVLVGWFMVRRAISGVEAVTRTARKISETDLGQRVPVMARHEEIDRLAVTFNQMLDRIEKLVVGIREMGDNIAHDLKSPVTRIRGLAEMSLSGASDATDDLSLAANTIEECDRLLDMINTMLMISKTDAGAMDMRPSPVNISEVVQGAVTLFLPLAEDKGLFLTCSAPESVMVAGDLRLLQRAIANLVDNAIKYTPSPGTIEIYVPQDKKNVEKIYIFVKDSGVGIEADDLPNIFNRFFRCDQSRTTGGSGLGLSLVKAVAHAHGGWIDVTSEPGKGSCFTLCLPCWKKP